MDNQEEGHLTDRLDGFAEVKSSETISSRTKGGKVCLVFPLQRMPVNLHVVSYGCMGSEII